MLNVRELVSLASYEYFNWRLKIKLGVIGKVKFYEFGLVVSKLEKV